MTTPYPFHFTANGTDTPKNSAEAETVTYHHVRGRIPTPQTSHLRSLIRECHADSSKIIAHPCTYDGLSSRLAEDAGFPILFLSGFVVASSHGLPDTGYIAMAEMCTKIQEVVRVTRLPVMVDGDTGYGGPMNVKRTVEAFAMAGAAGVMIEDQTWPKSMPSCQGVSRRSWMVSDCGRMRSYERKIGRLSR